jgi:endothelin-converting enzyme/putative endopeptidase
MNRCPLAAFALCTVLWSATSLPLQAQPAAAGVNTGNMDRAVKPGDDFYKYANGTYLAHTKIPADRSSVSVFGILGDRALVKSTAIITDPALAKAPEGSEQRKIADLYHAYMDEAAIEAHGRAALDVQLKAIAQIHSRHELAEGLGRSLRGDVDPLNAGNFHTANLFGLWVAPSFADPDHEAPYLLQGGLGLPGRDYYLTDSPRMKSIRDAYVQHLAANFRMAGFDKTEERAEGVLALEHSIAEKQVSLADSENIEHANNAWRLADFNTKAPGLEWEAYFRAAGLGSQTMFYVWQPGAFTAESALVASTPVETWKDLLAAHVMDQYAAAISKGFADERFNFSKAIGGAPQQRPREQRAVLLVNAVLGDAVGKLYAAKYFTPEEKAKVQQLVSNLITAFHARLEREAWMAPSTRAEALAKLATLKVGIGYPDTWRDYAGLEIKPDDLFGDLWRDSLFEYQYELSRIGKTVDRNEWVMTPQTVNAVNLPLDNSLNFPAAILQPPFYDPKAPDAVNYGAIGAVIGHEISHTFDSEGAAFDSKGQVRNWWTEADLKHFNDSTAALARQYDTYKPFPDLAVNGKQTLGENIADVAGLTAAYDAYHASLHGQPAPVVDGLTGDQQFFIAFAQNYAGLTREAALRGQVLGDGHSPGQYRALTVRNLDGWYAAFGVKPGDSLYLAPADRVHIW